MMRENAAEEAPEAEEAMATLLTADQAAQALGISTRRLRDWRKEGRIAEVGKFKRGTARIPLFAPEAVERLRTASAAEEATVATVATAADSAAFAEAVARRVALLLAERAAAEVATVAPLVAQITDQAERIGRLEAERESVEAQLTARDQALAAHALTIAELRRRAELAEAERDRPSVAQTAQEAPAAQGAPAAVQEAAPGVWGRLRRWWDERHPAG